jgi:hypothetical protein
MDTCEIKNNWIGRRVKLVVRPNNGVISVYEGTLIAEDATTYTISGARGVRSEPKLYTALEVC